MSVHRFLQVDVFAANRLRGNPLAVVLDADTLSDATMAAFANWTNLSETTFLLRPTDPAADYRVRIFTPARELPFAGHPTLGSCQAWLLAGGVPRGTGIVQQCGAGLIPIRRDGERLAFAAPPLQRSGPLEPDVLAAAVSGAGLSSEDVVAGQWVDNGPGWAALLLRSRAAVLAAQQNPAALGDLKLGLVGRCDGADSDVAFELRAFYGGHEDPVTGSLNASVAQWLIGAGLAPSAYVAAQGTALGRAGRIHIRFEAGDVWVGGAVQCVVDGTVTL